MEQNDDRMNLLLLQNAQKERERSDGAYSPILLWNMVKYTTAAIAGAALTTAVGIWVTSHITLFHL